MWRGACAAGGARQVCWALGERGQRHANVRTIVAIAEHTGGFSANCDLLGLLRKWKCRRKPKDSWVLGAGPYGFLALVRRETRAARAAPICP